MESKKPAFIWIGLEGLDNFIHRLKASIDEKDIFQDRIIKKDELIIESSQESKEKCFKPVKIQSNNSAFKSRENNFTSTNEPKMIESLFFSMFMDFCKQQFTMHSNNLNLNGSNEKKNMTSQPSHNDISTPKLSRHISTPPCSTDSNDFSTPHIRKTISIIVIYSFYIVN